MANASANSTTPTTLEGASKVVLLHGLARSAKSMQNMATALREQGYAICNIDYPSRQHRIENLASEHVLPAIQACFGAPLPTLNFVTHSLGGIVLRQLVQQGAITAIDRAVMLGPPNQGSEVVDKMRSWAPFKWLNGPAGQQLGTEQNSVPNTLGPAPFDLGIIAGSFSINPILSLMIPGDDDGKVSLGSARLDGMSDYLVLPVSHPFLMKNSGVIEQTLHFLKHGQFQHAE